ncbi:MAG: hypothetical protein KKB81_03700 [Candidatus Margulisbacteria bacterium]|nr:hypothetical protein [Candidatus Margulisiibacteriota bacterium]MBU1021689.1 hypothetical protein [Candidatus Margulisiibacteriota bacterium]MBU1729567.1 hypothetical protein [Candidatus Margulisiibacteriota bacterium]MBU1955053.1 hypothetical protein [Candidatus Margulisiibacteriota bacterium]
MPGKLNSVEKMVGGRGRFRVIVHGVSPEFRDRLLQGRGVKSTPMGLKQFACGEIYCQVGGAKERGRRSVPEATLKGAWTYIVSGWNPHTYAQDEMRLRVFMSAISRNGANSVVVFPHLPASNPVDLMKLANNLGRYAATRQLRAVLTYNFPLTSIGRDIFDLSAPGLTRKGVGSAYAIPIVRLDAGLLFKDYFNDEVGRDTLSGMVFSSFEGKARRSTDTSRQQHRDVEQEIYVAQFVRDLYGSHFREHLAVLSPGKGKGPLRVTDGNVENKIVVLFGDRLYEDEPLEPVIEAFLRSGASAVMIAALHMGRHSGRFQILEEHAGVDSVLTTDTISRPDEQNFGKLLELSVANDLWRALVDNFKSRIRYERDD